MAWVSGQQLQGGKYTIEQELGEGGFGITYRARDNYGRSVVIKTLNDQVQRHSDFAKFQQDFLNEAIKLAKCSHPHIVQIHEVINEDSLWCIVMQYIDGENLASRVENQGVLPEAEALRYIHQIGEALTVVHNNGLLHRDIKPQNIMLRSGKSEAVLIDFGIARQFSPNLTQKHTEYLSSGFAPIEQYEERAKRGAYTDVYALAATLYSLVTGEVPTMAPLRAIGTSLVEPKNISSHISDQVNQAILRGMEVKPENRPQSIQEWLALILLENNPANFPEMLGTWLGKFGSGQATLSITHQKEDYFDGTLIHKHFWNGTAKVAIEGNVNHETNIVEIKEIRIISGYWRLAENQGSLSSDGKTISGIGKDSQGSYKWALQRIV
ncbi:serine/threonine protein kinase [Trichormus variabilis ATCC 29413]|uniref:Serine/threonine protein kinase n=2 Tax=Anabaena variabilis TaxID=264691 RepID=Q3MF50_TRIV2|nr:MULTISPECIES: serine/threonine-protein kinase [Nostocaceae]ABA20386.1 serine/threonine protein kinase [Trichormus variabilis ATCC 29413]MBC1212636.1 serine/threonine protein kinase [Trichormus variabilis ARAD]MBC1254399.1 serine/threonine protein kinase [Trichormus variabilis V5]MBC1265521.1 serine/threonine protein kinase [Trichormus variabilis FSR]MBC1300548.1 serine/threonine protein kinase [Trichormus variabilis N2B]